jgi:hypothetical protein
MAAAAAASSFSSRFRSSRSLSPNAFAFLLSLGPRPAASPFRTGTSIHKETGETNPSNNVLIFKHFDLTLF